MKVMYDLRGGPWKLFESKEREVILSGPSETGKTVAACLKAHYLCDMYPGANGAIVRKTAKSLHGSVLQTFNRLTKGLPIIPFGGEYIEKYIYPNGSVIWTGGLDNPDKVLSSERDFIYVNQAEELVLNDWEMLTTRTTGRSAVIPYPQTYGDCNPGGSQHWIRERAKTSKLNLLTSVHKDNPTLWDDKANDWTEQGKRTLETLQGLTGVRRKRLFEGIWATAEGTVYDFDPVVHIKARDAREMLYWIIGIDPGYTNPTAMGLIGIDDDGRLHQAEEIYKTGMLHEHIVREAYDWARNHGGPTKVVVVVDTSAAELIAELTNAGLRVEGTKGRVLDGIAIVQELLVVQGDGKPRLTVDPSCVNTINEFESYVWKPGKDEPVKENDHTMDEIRYGAYWLYGEEFVQRQYIYNPARIG
jgi:phage terminase large subunit